MKKKLSNFLSNLKSFDAETNSNKTLFLSFFWTEMLKNPQITTSDLKILYQLANLSIPQNFGGELKNLLKSKRFTKTKNGYRLNIRAKEWVKSNITRSQSRPVIKNKLSDYVNKNRIKELTSVKSRTYDLLKLIELCEELNVAFQNNLYLSIPLLIRAILDHIPPIFVVKTFTEVANNYGTKSFRDSMIQLDNSSRKIADSFLHTQIRAKEVLPNYTQVDFSNNLDVLLGEIYRILK